jgi:hypothetical protein
VVIAKRYKAIGLALLLTVGCGSAQSFLPRLGEQRAGTAALTFLKLAVGARAQSMGGAYVAMANDAAALHWNPAGLVQIGNNELVMSHLDWLADIDFDYIGYVHQLNSSIGLGAFVGFLHLADMPVTTEYHPYGNGEMFSYSDLATGMSISIRMTDRFSFGVTGKYVREDLAGLIMDGYMLDLGTWYWTGYKSLRIAAAMRNFGTDLRPNGVYQRRTINGISERTYQSFSPPTVFTLGAAMDVFCCRYHNIAASMQMNHPMDDQENFVLGGEYSYHNLLKLRTGISTNDESNRWSFGAGTQISWYGKIFKFDYSYADYKYLQNTQQLTFAFEF